MPTPEINRDKQPFEEQLAFFRGKLGNLVPTAKWDDLQKSQHDRAFMVAGAAKADLLADFATAIEATMAEGKSLDWFREQFDTIVEQHGWAYNGERNWRTRVIYQTNMAASYAAGRLVQLRDPELQKLKPYWMYNHNDSVTNPRPLHVSWNGLTLPADHSWFKTHYPPNDWGCHCYVTAVSAKEAKRLGGTVTDTPPDDGVNPKTGMPNGIGKGWDYMPGDSVTDELRKMVDTKAATLPAPLAQGLRNDLVRTSSSHGGPPPISLAAMDVGQADGVREVLTAVSAGDNRYLPHGVKRVQVVDEAWIAGTDQRGYFALSRRPQEALGNRSGLEVMTTALTKVRDGKPLLFEEEYGIESLWHEVLHNSQRRRVPDKLAPEHLLMMEGLHQLIARQTYPDFMAMMGATPAHLRAIRERGPGYQRAVSGLTVLLRHLGRMDDNLEIEPGLLAKLQEIDITTTHVDTRQRLEYLLATETKMDGIDRVLRAISGGFPMTEDIMTKWLR